MLVHPAQRERRLCLRDGRGSGCLPTSSRSDTPASLYEAFEPAEAKRLADKLEIHYTPKHGSWLNMAEIELSVLGQQCLDRRVPDVPMLTYEVAAWEAARNQADQTVHWHFTTE